ncbi:hypothetical protein SASPL_153609 [Salvia splendens]|uniref:Uncharacterized protein n=2 Tax=Salvia splendens TaxID=180675 RepID=A0A8X8YXR0_SALSN|nr:hypothetical protein SASPL_153609 [Salvia splendens]
MRNICNELDKLIERGEMKQCKNLRRLLNKSVSFNGVKEFDRYEVPSLYLQEPKNCWSLPLVSLTSIAVALPNIPAHEANKLVSGVGEGLSLVKLVDGTLDRTGDMEHVKNAADAVWVGVELYRKWQDKDLQNTNMGDETYKETLQKLSNLGEKTVKDFTTRIEDIMMENPLNWPSKVIAANSMYRITQTILLDNKDNIHRTDKVLFEKLCVMISDILAACLTNLAHVIIFKCHNDATKDRQENVRRAAVLLGESREILELLQQHRLPSLDHEKAADIEEWRASMVHLQ